MSRVRRRVSRDLVVSDTTPAERAYFAWASAHMRDRVWASMNPDHPEASVINARTIRIRLWRQGEWDRLRLARIDMAEARRLMRRIPPEGIA